jgi:hypothetical protein
LVASLQGTKYDTGLDLAKLSEIAEYFRPLREEYIKSGLLDQKVLGVDVNALIYQVPGGMLSNLVSQLKQSGASDKFEEEINDPAEITSNPMPKLDHNTKKFLPDNILYFLSSGFIPKSELSSKNFTAISPRIIFIM